MPILDVVRETFYISGYAMLYIFAAVTAGFIGWAASYIAEEWILKKMFGARLKAYEDHMEVTRKLCVLLCLTVFLIVAVGLLFLRLAGALDHEYDDVAVPAGVALFGLLVFVCMCLSALMVVIVMIWGLERCLMCSGKPHAMDEETALLKRSTKATYGGAEENARDCGTQNRDAEEHGDHNRKERARMSVPLSVTSEPRVPERTWIKMTCFSSVKDIDMHRARP